MTFLRLAVVSDIHAEDTGGEWTHVVAEPTPQKLQHPLQDLPDLIRSADIAAEYLIVPGDIANQADASGLSYAWRKLQEIAAQLGAELIAVPGNHDVITHTFAEDPRSVLKRLLPSFPTGDPNIDDQFWRDGWMMLERPDHRILLLDSTVGFPEFPRNADTSSDEWKSYLRAIDRGSLTVGIEMSIDRYLDRHAERKINVAIIHHHPQEHQLRTILQDTYGPMYRGSDFIDILSRNPASGRWIIIHGHKHVPQLVNSVSTTSNGPLILCAGSLGAKLWSPINTITRNQFHLLTASDEFLGGVGSLCGKIDSFTCP
jgi:predicted phosphodiesterase